ncbi:MAG: DUF547 domain-containing protein [Gammaproteobacteria bacterium]
MHWLLLAMACGWSASSPASTPDFDAYEQVLLQNVRNGFVDYDGIAADPRFAVFVDQLAASPASVLDGPDGGMAFYLNAYNALAIQGILDGASPGSRWSRRTFFRKLKYTMIGEPITLEDLEHERIMKMGDPRIHFAIVCASMSCPRLASRAYRTGAINTQLHDAARDFINDPTRNRFDLERRIAFVSKIFDWYADDFEKAGGSVQRYLARFAEDAEVQEALRAEEFELRHVDYDWSLNGYFSGKTN